MSTIHRLCRNALHPGNIITNVLLIIYLTSIIREIIIIALFFFFTFNDFVKSYHEILVMLNHII